MQFTTIINILQVNYLTNLNIVKSQYFYLTLKHTLLNVLFRSYSYILYINYC